MTETTIKWIKIEQKHEALKRPFVTALHQVNEITAVRVRIGLANGYSGVGAAVPNEQVTGDILASMIVVMEQLIKPALLGQDVQNWNDLLEKLHQTIRGNTPAKAAFEIALYDLRAQLFQISLTALLGGKPRQVATDYTISLDKPAAMLTRAQKITAAGFSSLKIKLGEQQPAADILLVERIAKAVPTDISFRIDINQAWSVKQTLAAAAAWSAAKLKIDFIEQPVSATDLFGMQQLTAMAPFPIMADESVHSAQDALKVIQLHACDFVNIKLMKTGGLSQAQIINDLCQTAGIKCMVGCMIESRESIAAAAAFAAANTNVIYADLDSVFMSVPSAETGGFTIQGTSLLPSNDSGLGFKQKNSAKTNGSFPTI
ncbi:l-alanine-dl-glutamate epimerase related enzyme of enolase superfamily protein [Liquorilactobacillus ghanensis DSM 18630]|uniref:Dipeptide epimerase n=1 Tax=Liquorilactobacillus ghanensis DSM 18630 TaxID=1423750 RepID=A0A0R1VFK4_9LACO|nr:dipeptide epimerase [Liquorilactobacillus ghanensis]KRM04053.1 l-alanine-dl-glutamate epimerase related enzyme of enolase superfamily protein [Liquorilactobacillus ghanensis DSM 18630]